MFYTYIIYSAVLDRYYIGSTGNLEARLADHNNSRSTYTKRGKPWVLEWSEEFPARSDAAAEELRIKRKKSRKYIEYLIGSTG